MNSAMTLDSKFIQISTPILSEFGFSGIKELVTEQLSLMIQSKIDHYEAEDRLYTSRFGLPYDKFVLKYKESGAEDFDSDDILNDWRFAKEATALYRYKMKEILNA